MSRAPDYIAASNYLCEIYEREVVIRLPRTYRRQDNKLTPTERDRLAQAFRLTWDLFASAPETLDAQLANLTDLRGHVRISEVAVYLGGMLDAQEERTLVQLMAYEDQWQVPKSNSDMVAIHAAARSHLERIHESLARFHRPDDAPLNCYAMFDHWQEEFVDIYEWVRASRCWNLY